MGNDIETARDRIKDALSLTVFTGAGVSAESGIPTFRDKGGIWEKIDPMEVATPEAFNRDPKFVWEWYALRMNACGEVKPNPAHLAIARLEKSIREFSLVTQNIDNLHRVAGNERIIELHGNIWRTRCLECKKKSLLEVVPRVFPPECPNCNGMLRPDVVWFGENLDPDILRAAHAACETEVFLIVGTSGVVWPAAGLAYKAKSNGAFVIEINTEQNALSEISDISLFGKAGEILPKLVYV